MNNVEAVIDTPLFHILHVHLLSGCVTRPRESDQWCVVACLAFVGLPNVNDKKLLVGFVFNSTFNILVQISRPSPPPTAFKETWQVLLTRHSCVVLDLVPRSRYTDGTETRFTTSNATSSKSSLHTRCRVSTKPKNPPYQRTHSRMSYVNSQTSTMTSTFSQTPRWKCSVRSSQVIQVLKSHPKYSCSLSPSAPRTVHASRRARVRRRNSQYRRGIAAKARMTLHKKEVTKATATT